MTGKRCVEGLRLLDAYSRTKFEFDRKGAQRALDAYLNHRPTCAICWQQPIAADESAVA